MRQRFIEVALGLGIVLAGPSAMAGAGESVSPAPLLRQCTDDYSRAWEAVPVDERPESTFRPLRFTPDQPAELRFADQSLEEIFSTLSGVYRVQFDFDEAVDRSRHVTVTASQKNFWQAVDLVLLEAELCCRVVDWTEVRIGPCGATATTLP